MRMKKGQKVRVFNQIAGEYLAEIKDIKKEKAVIFLVSRIKDAPLLVKQCPVLAFGMIKKKSMHLIVEKAVELGVSSIEPLVMDNVQVQKIKEDRLKKWAIEAVEQSEQIFVPGIESPTNLETFLDKKKGKRILWACERSEEKIRGAPAKKLKEVFKGIKERPIFLVGPEGGFSERECDLLRNSANIIPVDLGDSILRAETACLMMLSVYRAIS